MSKMYIPEDYVPALNLKETQIAIKEVKDFFQRQITAELNLHRVSAPLFVTPESGLNDKTQMVWSVRLPLVSRSRMTARSRSYILWQNGREWHWGVMAFL